jgi:hypothetical protein
MFLVLTGQICLFKNEFFVVRGTQQVMEERVSLASLTGNDLANLQKEETVLVSALAAANRKRERLQKELAEEVRKV